MPHRPMLALRRTAEDDLGSLRCSRKWSDVRNTSALDGQEGEEESQED